MRTDILQQAQAIRASMDAASGKYVPVPAMQGPPYTLTEADKAEIAALAAKNKIHVML